MIIGIHWVNLIQNPATSEEKLTNSPHNTNIIGCKSSSSLCCCLFVCSPYYSLRFILLCVWKENLFLYSCATSQNFYIFIVIGRGKLGLKDKYSEKEPSSPSRAQEHLNIEWNCTYYISKDSNLLGCQIMRRRLCYILVLSAIHTTKSCLIIMEETWKWS